MYAFLKGKVEAISADSIEIDVNGVGYEVICDLFTLSSLQVGKEAKIYTSLQVSKDMVMSLYGFASPNTKVMFELLISVSGIGAKGAIKIISKLKPDEIAMAIATENEAAFKGAASPKMASRIIVDLKKKVGSLDTGSFSLPDNIDMSEVTGTSALKEATDALTGLGFSYSEAMQCVKSVMKEGMSTEDIIFQALKRGESR